MKYKFLLMAFAFLFAILACSLAGPAPSTPTPFPLPATPAPLPLPTQSFLLPAPSSTTAPAAKTFAGTWIGPDPDDGSIQTMGLLQDGNTLAGTFKDTFSGIIPPPGYEGAVSGTVISPTTAQVTLRLSRHDGKTLVLPADLTLSDPDTLVLKLTTVIGTPWILKRSP